MLYMNYRNNFELLDQIKYIQIFCFTFLNVAT